MFCIFYDALLILGSINQIYIYVYVHLYVYVGVCISYVLVLIVIRFVDSEEAFENFGVAEEIYREKLPCFEFSYFGNELGSNPTSFVNLNEGSKSKDCLTRYFL